jgi:hypothetical protein
MDEQSVRAIPRSPSGWWEETKPILLLVFLAILLRAWQLTHTEVPARDALGYIDLAWRLEHEPWGQVVRSSFRHPGYPLSIVAVSGHVRSLIPGDLPMTMQLSAQFASALASVLLVVPMFLLGRELFDRRVCFWAVLLFQCLPATGRLMADGLSEPLFLLCASTALFAAARALCTGALGWFVVSGIASGLAYLTRVEGIVLVGVSGLMLTVFWVAGHWPGGWRRWLACGHALVVPALLVALPFMLAIGGLTNKPTARQLGDLHRHVDATPTRVLSGTVLFAAYADNWEPVGKGSWSWSLRTLPTVLARGFFYVFWVPALVGLWWFRSCWVKEPAAWLLLLTASVIIAVMVRVGAVLGYISDRHLVLVLLAGVYWATAAILLFADALSPWWPKVRWSLVVPLVCCVVPLVKTTEGLHQDREGFRQAGYWLAAHLTPGDKVDDAYTWAAYYAGVPFRATTPSTSSSFCYLVIEEAGNAHSHLPEVKKSVQLATTKGRLVQTWNVPRGEVRIYRMPCAEYEAATKKQ